jgi:hypothetical protein
MESQQIIITLPPDARYKKTHDKNNHILTELFRFSLLLKHFQTSLQLLPDRHTNVNIYQTPTKDEISMAEAQGGTSFPPNMIQTKNLSFPATDYMIRVLYALHPIKNSASHSLDESFLSSDVKKNSDPRLLPQLSSSPRSPQPSPRPHTPLSPPPPGPPEPARSNKKVQVPDQLVAKAPFDWDDTLADLQKVLETHPDGAQEPSAEKDSTHIHGHCSQWIPCLKHLKPIAPPKEKQTKGKQTNEAFFTQLLEDITSKPWQVVCLAYFLVALDSTDYKAAEAFQTLADRVALDNTGHKAAEGPQRLTEPAAPCPDSGVCSADTAFAKPDASTSSNEERFPASSRKPEKENSSSSPDSQAPSWLQWARNIINRFFSFIKRCFDCVSNRWRPTPSSSPSMDPTMPRITSNFANLDSSSPSPSSPTLVLPMMARYPGPSHLHVPSPLKAKPKCADKTIGTTTP